MALEVPLKRAQNDDKSGPAGIAVNPIDGEIAIADLKNNRILLYDGQRNFLREFGHSGKGKVEFREPFGVAYTSGDKLVVTEQINQRVQLFDTKTGQFLRFGSGKLKNPLGVSVDGNGRIIVCDSLDGVQVFDSQLESLLLRFPVKSAVDDTRDPFPYWCLFLENKFFVTDYNNCCIKVYSHSGKFFHQIQLHQEGDSSGPRGLCVDKNSNKLIVCDWEDGIKIVSFDGEIVGRSDEPLPKSYQATKFLDGNIVVTRFEEGKLSLPLINYFQ